MPGTEHDEADAFEDLRPWYGQTDLYGDHWIPDLTSQGLSIAMDGSSPTATFDNIEVGVHFRAHPKTLHRALKLAANNHRTTFTGYNMMDEFVTIHAGDRQNTNDFYKEAFMRAGLIHYGIPRTHAITALPSPEGSFPAYITEQEQGYKLSDVISKGQLRGRVALNILSQLAATLDYLHQEQVVYNALHPDSIRLFQGQHGELRVHLTDFSQARLLCSHYRPVKYCADNPFAARELQLLDSYRTPYSPKSDQYSFARLAKFVVTNSKLAKPIKIPGTLIRDVPQWMEKTISRGLAHPDDRFESCSALMEQIFIMQRTLGATLLDEDNVNTSYV